jgi:hypothetical protein
MQMSESYKSPTSAYARLGTEADFMKDVHAREGNMIDKCSVTVAT